MKRLLMGFAACTLMMASCSQNEVFENVSEGQGQLSFSPATGKATTKAAELMNSGENDIKTKAGANGVIVTAYHQDNTTSAWSKWFGDGTNDPTTGEGVIYKDDKWQLKNSVRFRLDKATKFITYFAEAGKGTLSNPQGFTSPDFSTTFPSFDYQVGANSAEQADLIAGVTNVAKNKTDIVLGMRHILSQINFGTRGYRGAKINIRNINIVGLYNKATYTYQADDNGTSPNIIGQWNSYLSAARDASYPYYNYNNEATNPQPEVYVAANETTKHGDVYIFGDGGNAGPGRSTDVWYPIGTAPNAWANANSTDQTGLANSLMLMPQSFVGDDAKVTFEYYIVDKDDASVAGNSNQWQQGEFKLDFSTGVDDGKHYMARWDQNYRYVYLIDFTDFLDGIALTFKVDVEMYPWENYNKDSDDDDIVNIMAAGQPSTTNMNTITNKGTWYIASQSKTDPTRFDPAKWAQVMRNETWDLSTYDFANIDAGESFILDFTNVIFNTQTDPVVGSPTQIDLTLPDGYTTTGSEITVTPNTPPRYTVMNAGKTSGTITIVNTKYCNKAATLAAKIAAITAGTETWYYKGTEAVNLTTMQPTTVTNVSTITVKFTSSVIPTVGATTNGAWTNPSNDNKTYVWTKN